MKKLGAVGQAPIYPAQQTTEIRGRINGNSIAPSSVIPGLCADKFTKED